MNDTAVFQAVDRAAREGRAAALATVIRTRGSVPRHVGSHMVVAADGRLVGTIGGGCGEAEVMEVARDVMRSGRPRIVRVELMDDVASFSPAVCGGVMEVFVEPVSPGSDVAEADATSADGAA